MTINQSVRLFASAQSWIEGEAVRQLYATAKLDGVRHAVGFPDLHPGKGSPVGAAFVTEGVIYPHLIGGDIGCGMALFKTDLVRREAKLDRWAKLRFDLEHPWDQFVSDFLAEHDLESTEFDSALGTIGGGNHFAELQAVEKVLDADEFKKLGLGKQQLVVLVHSGSRGLGESILRAHVDQHFGDGVEADSFAAEEYLRGHDFAVRWAKANRELIARRFAAALGAEAECLWDGCHNSITVASASTADRGESSYVCGVHRKGAVAADSDFVVIPGSRGSLSYLVKPTGDGESHAWSLAHGAGRKWSRSEAVCACANASAMHAVGADAARRPRDLRRARPALRRSARRLQKHRGSDSGPRRCRTRVRHRDVATAPHLQDAQAAPLTRTHRHGGTESRS